MLSHLLINSMNTMHNSDLLKGKHIRFGINAAKPDKTDSFCKNKENSSIQADLENPKKQQEFELKVFKKHLQKISRTEIATEKYELCKWGSEIDDLKKLSKKGEISESQQSRLNFLIEKLNLIFQKEKETEELLKPFHPADTVSENSEIPEHHKVYGFNSFFREAIEKRANKFIGLSEDEIKKMLEREKLMEKLDKEFEQLPPLEHDCVVYKGLSEQDPNSMIKGDTQNKPFELMEKANVNDIVVPDTAYTYTAFNRSTAEAWGGEGARHLGRNGKEFRIMMYEIYIPKGAKVSRNMEHNGEVLMPRGAKYKIINKKILKNGDMEIGLEYIPHKNQ